MTSKKTPTYVPMPKVPAKLQPRYEEVMRALAGASTVSGAAEALQMSRNHFQTLLHRCMEAVITELEPKQRGRPGRPEREKELEAEVDRLRRENRKLAERVAMVDRLLGVASDLVTGKVAMRRPRATSTKTGSANELDVSGDDPDRAAAVLAKEHEMKSLGVHAPLRAAILSKGCSTLRRWRTKGTPRPRARAARPLTLANASAAEAVLRKLNGKIGAVALSKAVPGLSRRDAAKVATTVRTCLERERKERALQVIVPQPGMIRGFDAMELGRGRGHILVATDAAVPYRTTIRYARRYDVAAVREVLAEDFARYGAPLVLRMDRARQHRTPEISQLLDQHGVVALHGPPRHPCYYGQLERQNREHRAWLEAIEPDDAAVAASLEEMRRVLNEVLPRKRLGWQTAAARWEAAPVPSSARDAFLRDLCEEENRARISGTEREPLTIRRVAIERALIKNCLLKVRTAEDR